MWVSSWHSSTKLRRLIAHLALRVRLAPAARSRASYGTCRVAAHPVVVLHPALGRQPVVVPADRVEHVLAAHPLVAGDQVGVGVGEHVSHVQRPDTVGGGVSMLNTCCAGRIARAARTRTCPLGLPAADHLSSRPSRAGLSGTTLRPPAAASGRRSVCCVVMGAKSTEGVRGARGFPRPYGVGALVRAGRTTVGWGRSAQSMRWRKATSRRRPNFRPASRSRPTSSNPWRTWKATLAALSASTTPSMV